MVSIERENAYQLREYLHRKVIECAHGDPFKSTFLRFLGLSNDGVPAFNFASLSLYQRSAIAGLGVLDETVSSQDISRLLGQAAKIDSTPRPWVSDVFGVMAVKWLAGQMNNSRITREFENWISGFLAQQASSDHLNLFEKDIAAYIRSGESAVCASACVATLSSLQEAPTDRGSPDPHVPDRPLHGRVPRAGAGGRFSGTFVLDGLRLRSGQSGCGCRAAEWLDPR